MRRLSSPPTLPGHSVLGSWPDVLADPLALCSRACCALGGVARIRGLGSSSWLLVSDTVGVEHVLSRNSSAYRAPTSALASSLFGVDLVLDQHDSWFGGSGEKSLLDERRFTALVDAVTAAAATVADDWERAERDGRPVDIVEDTASLTMRATIAALFSLDGSPASASLERTFADALGLLDSRPTALGSPGLASTRRNWRVLQARGVVDHLLADLVRQRRASGRAGQDLLGSLLRARGADSGARMSDRVLSAELWSLLLAGARTAAATLAWCCALLARQKDAMLALQEEAEAVLGPRGVTAADLPRLPYARAVTEEALRLFPPSWGLPREARVSDEIAGYHVPAGTLVVLARWVTHRSAELWVDPARFDPGRFLGDRAADHLPLAYYPFGGGVTLGPAAEVTVTIVQVALATLARDFSIAAPLGEEIRPDATFTLRPRPPSRLHVARRGAGAPSLELPAEEAILLQRASAPGEFDETGVCVIA